LKLTVANRRLAFFSVSQCNLAFLSGSLKLFITLVGSHRTVVQPFLCFLKTFIALGAFFVSKETNHREKRLRGKAKAAAFQIYLVEGKSHA
jgi:hypothetical protein